MQKDSLVLLQMRQCNTNYIPRACKPCLTIADPGSMLEVLGIEPPVDEGEVPAAMIDLPVLSPYRSTVLDNCRVFFPSVPDAGQVLCQVDSGTRIVFHAEKKHLPIEIVDTTDRAVVSMGRVDGMAGSDPIGLRTDCSECMWTVASNDAREPPEYVCNRTHTGTRRGPEIKGMIIILGHARHDQRAIDTDRGPQRFDQAAWAPFHRPYLRESRMDQQHAGGPNAEIA